MWGTRRHAAGLHPPRSGQQQGDGKGAVPQRSSHQTLQGSMHQHDLVNGYGELLVCLQLALHLPAQPLPVQRHLQRSWVVDADMVLVHCWLMLYDKLFSVESGTRQWGGFEEVVVDGDSRCLSK